MEPTTKKQGRTMEQINEQRLANCKVCEFVTYKAGMTVCKKAPGKLTRELSKCPNWKW